MFRESIAKLLHGTVAKLSQLGRPKVTANQQELKAESQPLELELDASYNPDHSKMRLTVVKQRNDLDPLYKRHDGYLFSSVPDRTENNAGAERWKLGRYSPLSSAENLSTFFSTFGTETGIAKNLNSGHGRPLNEIESMNMIMTSQLKMTILNRYVQEANQKIAHRESFTNFSQQPEAQPSGSVISGDTQDSPVELGADDYQRVDEEICVFDDQLVQDFVSSCDVAIADPIDSELIPVGDQRISQPRSFAHLRAMREEHRLLQEAVEKLCAEDDRVFEEALTVASEPQTEPDKLAEPVRPVAAEETPFQRIFGRRRLLIDGIGQSRQPKQSVPKPAAKPVVHNKRWTGSLYSLDENSNYFANPLPQYSGIDQVDTIDLTPVLDIEEPKLQEDPWISSEPAIGDQPVAAEQPPTEDDLECIRYIFSSDAQLHVLRNMAENPDTAQYVLAQLAYHPDADVRCAVADNANSPIEARWLLAQDENQTVRYMVAENINTPAEVLAGLAKDDNAYINSRARRTLERLRGNSVVSVKFGNNVVSLTAS